MHSHPEINRYKPVALLLILAATFLCSRYLIQLALVQGDSMLPSYHHLQLVLVDRTSKSYARGDVVLFRKDGIKGVLIKRIAACPGDHLQIIDGVLHVNGEVQTTPERFEIPGRAEEMLVLEAGQYFALGDNINHSIDSRMDEMGNVSADDILGRVIFPTAHNPFST